MVDKNIDYASSSVAQMKPGPFLAKVVSHLEPSYMGALDVQLLRPVGNTEDAGQLHTVKYMTPFYGTTSVDFTTESPDEYNNTQKSYGMWMIPPDVGTTVIVIFIDGDPRKGYWIGCVPDEGVNFMVPGLAATKFVVDGDGTRVPVAEYNKAANTQVTDVTKIPKPRHPIADVLEAQGLLKDDIRGITTSSARRELPSAVFGISTPGPIDKKGPKWPVGKEGSKVNAFVSRLGGSSFVMDDGDDKYLRKTKAFQGPPDYAAIEQGEDGGDVGIPHNELVRIRTRTGHQILLHNSEDLIYIGNARGTTWIELTSMGKIDIYAKDSISIHTENDFNVTADRDINFTAKGNINLNAGKNIFATATSNIELKATADGKITAKTINMGATGGAMNLSASAAANLKGGANVNITAAADTNIKAGGKHTENATGYYSLPGGSGTAAVSGVAPTATVATAAFKAGRIPLVEPWAGHENLNPLFSMPDSTAASATPAQPNPDFYKKYTTTTDTFEQIKPAESK
jgi:phage baseplate assembly protein gpV